MSGYPFTKMVASGNDFVVAEASALRGARLPEAARRLCHRTEGIGADGLLVLGPSRRADVRMRIFNADGSEAEMCGNGSRCAALYAAGRPKGAGVRTVTLETLAGLIPAEVRAASVKVRLTDPKDFRFDVPLKVNGRAIRVNYVDTGVPHAVIFVHGLSSLDVPAMGPAVRYHAHFAPRGTNVNYIEPLGADALAIRTYERGVEDETLACGTGSTAAALVLAHATGARNRVRVRTKSGETLTIHFTRTGNTFTEVWLEGGARAVYKGVVA